jgi:hypothetical protein
MAVNNLIKLILLALLFQGTQALHSHSRIGRYGVFLPNFRNPDQIVLSAE